MLTIQTIDFSYVLVRPSDQLMKNNYRTGLMGDFVYLVIKNMKTDFLFTLLIPIFLKIRDI
jgi:hypothetical protein